jgi:hypothetical protein
MFEHMDLIAVIHLLVLPGNVHSSFESKESQRNFIISENAPDWHCALSRYYGVTGIFVLISN